MQHDIERSEDGKPGNSTSPAVKPPSVTMQINGMLNPEGIEDDHTKTARIEDMAQKSPSRADPNKASKHADKKSADVMSELPEQVQRASDAGTRPRSVQDVSPDLSLPGQLATPPVYPLPSVAQRHIASTASLDCATNPIGRAN